VFFFCLALNCKRGAYRVWWGRECLAYGELKERFYCERAFVYVCLGLAACAKLYTVQNACYLLVRDRRCMCMQATDVA
jgi:hypothetical protein